MQKKCIFCPFLLKKWANCVFMSKKKRNFAPVMRNLPIVSKYIILVNLMVLLFDMTLQQYGVQLTQIMGLHYVTAPTFRFWQPLTYMFMHGGFGHLFCNMFAVLMFAPILENEWGSKRFLIYYLICGLGAALVQESVWAIKVQSLLSDYEATSVMVNYAGKVVTVGASGAVFGILLAFGWLFPDVKMFLLFLPIPVRARVFVLMYAAFELMAGFSNLPGDNVAHFAHLGGMLFGWLLLLWWRHGEGFFSDLWHKWIKKNEDPEDPHSGYHYHRRL